ncbi:phage tail protein [Terracoccus sp. 273MFTsu3.1]|uniref:phage tail protein n=1 Tax=Terracoccus sp. 273MFTsu3.1 TaxID=1172188 RepID=UPI000366AC2D|nr:phage tail protein [Terracoccus sp. 273MFTsu3.1]
MATTTSIGHIATDPLRNFKFDVNIAHPGFPAGFLKMGFMNVSGLSQTTEVIPYREGGMNTTTQKMPGQTDFAPISLSRGVIVGPQPVLQWVKQLFTVQQGTGTRSAGLTDFRATLTINVKDHPVTRGKVPVKAQFKVYNAWPTAVAWSDLDAGANAIMVNQITLAHEGFDHAVAKDLGANSEARV